MDSTIGQIIEALSIHGIENNTLVFVAADNGPADLGSVDCDDIGEAGPYQGLWQRNKSLGGGGGTFKSTTWEGT